MKKRIIKKIGHEFEIYEDAPKQTSSTLHHLLLRHKLPLDFPLEQEIKEFNLFWNKAQVAPLNLNERLEAFAKEKNWTDDDRKNFRIMSAIKDGWGEIFGRTAKEHLIAQKHGQGADWVYKYECRNCGSVDKRGIKRALSQNQYDQLIEDEALKTLLGQREVNNPAAELRGIKNQKLIVLGADT